MVEDAISFWTDIQRYEDMLAADPSSYCFVPLSELYRNLGLLDDAISVAKKGSDKHPDYPPGFFALGTALNAKGEKDQARAALEHTVSLKGDHVEALKLLGQLCVEAGEIERAKAVLGRALRQDPGDTESELLLHSIDPGYQKPQPEEEVIEDVEVIEDLTEVLDNGGRPQVAPEVAAAVAGGWGESRKAEPSAAENEQAGFLEESTDFWGLGIPGEAKSAGDEPFEEEFSGFDASDDYQPRVETEPPAPGRVAGAGSRDPLSTATLAELYVSQGHIDKALGIYQQLLAENQGNQGYRQRVTELIALAEQQLQTAEGGGPAKRQEALPPQAPLQQQSPLGKQESAWQQEGAVPQQETVRPQGAVPQYEAIRQEAAQTQEAVPQQQGTPQMDLEGELVGWLENIRRRKDGV
jgi:tetratricopeptide (TPR) repeat protein